MTVRMKRVDRTVRWIAGRDGIAHAVPSRGRWIRTSCRLPATDERLSWTTLTRCTKCSIALGFVL